MIRLLLFATIIFTSNTAIGGKYEDIIFLEIQKALQKKTNHLARMKLAQKAQGKKLEVVSDTIHD